MGKVILKNGEEITITNGGPTGFQAEFESLEAMIEAQKKLTEENMESINFVNDAGETHGVYTDKYSTFTRYSVLRNGKIEADFSFGSVDLTQKELKALRKELAEIKEGQAVQDGAIIDLGAMVSDMTGGEA